MKPIQVLLHILLGDIGCYRNRSPDFVFLCSMCHTSKVCRKL